MKKFVLKISSIVAGLSLSSAYIGAGLASSGGWYQPKVPTRIAK